MPSISSLLTAKSATERASIKAVALRDEWHAQVGKKAYVLVHPSDSSLRITVSDIMAPLRKSYPMLETRTFLERKVGKRWLYVPTDPWGHFRFGNPPFRVPDGTTRLVTLEDGTQVERDNFKEDPLAAAQIALWETVLWWAGRTDYATQEGGFPTGPYPPGMTTDTFYGIEGDGRLYNLDSVYANARASADTVSTTATERIGQVYNSAGGTYACYELFVAFNTSTIVDTAVVSAATLSMDGAGDSSTTDFTAQVRPKVWTPSGLTTADFVAGADLSSLTLLATWASSSYSSGYNNFSSEAAFNSAINKTGNTELLIHSDRHAAGTTPSGNEYVLFTMANETGTTTDPKLVVTYTVPAGWMGFNDLQGGLNHDMTGGF